MSHLLLYVLSLILYSIVIVVRYKTSAWTTKFTLKRMPNDPSIAVENVVELYDWIKGSWPQWMSAIVFSFNSSMDK